MAGVARHVAPGLRRQNVMDRRDVESFYHLPDGDVSGRACRGLACFVARYRNPERWQSACAPATRVYCLGACYGAPAAAGDEARPAMAVHARAPIVLRNLGPAAAPTLELYRSRGGYRTLESVRARDPEGVVRAIERSELRGRGGAGYLTGRKWRAVFSQTAPEKVVVANADEGDPGAYIDRFILEDNPHAVLEALAIAGHAVGARRGYIYLRAEYPAAHAHLDAAIDEGRRAGLFGQTGPSTFDVQLEVGRGSYVCGEETALLNAIEGRRPAVRARPPFPAEAGLFGRPTLVNNVETLAAVPWIVEHGPEAYRDFGFSTSRGTKVLSLNSLFRRPGLYEIEFGMSVRQIVEELGGGFDPGTPKGVIIGGPLAGVIPPSLLDTPLGFDELHAIGASVGHGGVVAFDEGTSVAELVHHVFDFGAYESCAKCTPCRLGARRIEEIFRGVTAGETSPARDEWRELVRALALTSLCGHGSGLAAFADSIGGYYSDEVAPCFAS
jgi:NADH:ubiquinone oxidoreductase subunit F (NADH-binding)